MSDDDETLIIKTNTGFVYVLDRDGEITERSEIGATVWAVGIAAGSQTVGYASDTTLWFRERPDDAAGFLEPATLPAWLPYVLVGAVGFVGILGFIALRPTKSGQRGWQGAAQRHAPSARRIWRARVSYLFLVPTVVLLIVFAYYPAFSGIYHSFTRWIPGSSTTWIGLENFRGMMNNRYLITGTGNLLILIVAAILKLALPLFVAELLFHLRLQKVSYWMRTLFVLQVIVPGVVGILIWVNIYDPTIGLANQTLRAMGLDDFTRSWLGDSGTALWAIVFIGFPWVSALALLIFYGGLISIPSELIDAAYVDGASVWRRILKIDLPLLLGQIRLLLILTFITVMQDFAIIFLTTGGGPGDATYVPSLEMYYQAVRFNNFGMASAIGAALFLAILGATILNLRYVKSSVEYTS